MLKRLRGEFAGVSVDHVHDLDRQFTALAFQTAPICGWNESCAVQTVNNSRARSSCRQFDCKNNYSEIMKMGYRIGRSLAVWAAALLVLLYVHHDMHRATGRATVVGILWALGERFLGRWRRQ